MRLSINSVYILAAVIVASLAMADAGPNRIRRAVTTSGLKRERRSPLMPCPKHWPKFGGLGPICTPVSRNTASTVIISSSS
ncbi:hypothetical protein BDF19DRAFT_429154 [Syncephalis fuscata]|nr:hypothetical protein BDF19DRAFT_429154 [Syncephalis fuscata]